MLSTRWDSSLQELGEQFIVSILTLRVAATRIHFEGSNSADLDEIRIQQQNLRRLTVQIRILGTPDVQRASRLALRHAFAVKVVAEGREDPRLGEFPERSPYRRLTDSLHEFTVAIRKQLRVEGPENVLLDDPDDWH